MRRGRLSRYIKPTVLYMGELTKTDCYASAYYLYRISEMLAGTEEQFEQQVALFFKLAIRLKYTQAISDYLEKMVEKAEKQENSQDFSFRTMFQQSSRCILIVQRFLLFTMRTKMLTEAFQATSESTNSKSIRQL